MVRHGRVGRHKVWVSSLPPCCFVDLLDVAAEVRDLAGSFALLGVSFLVGSTEPEGSLRYLTLKYGNSLSVGQVLIDPTTYDAPIAYWLAGALALERSRCDDSR